MRKRRQYKDSTLYYYLSIQASQLSWIVRSNIRCASADVYHLNIKTHLKLADYHEKT